MGNKNENIQLFILEEMRRRNSTQSTMQVLQEPEPQLTATTIIEEKTMHANQSPIDFMAELDKERKALQNEKDQLIANKQILKFKIAEQIETRKRRIEQYKAEITELKQNCQTLQNAIETPIAQ